MPLFGRREKIIVALAGLLGGMISSLVGTGANPLVFMVMVRLFRVDEKIVTPTTVVLMTMVMIPGFLLHLFLLKDFKPAVMRLVAANTRHVCKETFALLVSTME